MLSEAAIFGEWPYHCVNMAVGSSDLMFVATLFLGGQADTMLQPS